MFPGFRQCKMESISPGIFRLRNEFDHQMFLFCWFCRCCFACDLCQACEIILRCCHGWCLREGQLTRSVRFPSVFFTFIPFLREWRAASWDHLESQLHLGTKKATGPWSYRLFPPFLHGKSRTFYCHQTWVTSCHKAITISMEWQNLKVILVESKNHSWQGTYYPSRDNGSNNMPCCP